MKKLFLLFVFFYLAIFQTLISKDINVFHFLDAHNKWKHQSNVSIGAIILPREVFEDALSQIPVLNYSGKIQLPANFTNYHKLSTIFLSNHISTGFAFNLDLDFIKIAPSIELGYWFGFYSSEGIDVSSKGFTLYPSIILSKQFYDFYVTGKFGLMYQTQRTFAGNNQLGRTISGYTGFFLSLIGEKEFLHDNFITFEFKFNYTKFHNLTWLSYATFANLLLYPEILIGVNL